MACPQCAKNQKSHSFTKFGQKEGTGYWYTAPAAAEEPINTVEKFTYFKAHMEQAKQDATWVWIFDCAGMKVKHYASIDFMRRLVKSMSEDHGPILKEVWFVNPNVWIRTSIKILKPFINKDLVSKISFVDDTGAEFISRLTGVRLSAAPWKV